MQSKAKSISEFLESLPAERKEAVAKLRDVVVQNLPKGFEERISSEVIWYVVPHSLFPDGYHCDPDKPLGFISIASQKNCVALHHMGIYGNENLRNWFISEYGKRFKQKLDIGKSCIRFKKVERIPFDIVGELAKKITPEEWIKFYQKAISKK